MHEQPGVLLAEVRELLVSARAGLGPEAHVELDRVLKRIDEPLRVAIAGKVKAGKSTLLNALVGERIAPTDTGECTRIVTWYRNGHTYQVMLHPREGAPPVQVSFRKGDDAVEIDLGPFDPAAVDHLDVMWPSSSLRRITLIDTPGVDSVNAEVGARSAEFLGSSDQSTPADAVLYLMKHMHTSDLRLLEAFHDDEVARPNPINAIAILSRADEIGVGRLDSLASARRIAARYEGDPKLRRLVQMVVPVAGLLGETARTLTQAEFEQLRALAGVPVKTIESYLLSTDRFVEAGPEIPLTSIDRGQLLGRFGLFGIRLSLALLRRQVATTASELSSVLLERSGLANVQELLTTLFLDRSEVLKARSGLLALERLCHVSQRREEAERLLAEMERITAGAHPFQELSTLAALRSGNLKAKKDDMARLERVLGASGAAPWQRLGLAPDASADEVNQGSFGQIADLQRLAESPFASRDLSVACQVAIRSLEGLIRTG